MSQLDTHAEAPWLTVENEIKLFAKGGPVLNFPKSIETGDGRFVWLLYECWRMKSRKKTAARHSFANLERWISEKHPFGLAKIKSLQHKLKGRRTTNVVEVKTLIAVMFLNWDVIEGKSQPLDDIPEKELICAADVLASFIFRDAEEVVISEKPEFIFSGKTITAIYRLDAGAKISTETVLTSIANEKSVVLSLTDIHGVLSGDVSVVPLAIKPVPNPYRKSSLENKELAVHAVLSPLNEGSPEVLIILPVAERPE